jgi:hypothetical protein
MDEILANANAVFAKIRPEYREWLEVFHTQIHIDEDQDPSHRGMFFVLSPPSFYVQKQESKVIREVEDFLIATKENLVTKIVMIVSFHNCCG